MKLRLLGVLLLLTICGTPTFAGDIDRLLFTLEGERIILTEDFDPDSEFKIIKPKIPELCESEVETACFKWQLFTGDPALDELVLPVLQAAFDLWSAEEGINILFEDNGISTDGAIPYVPNGNGEIEGDFLVSFNPPASVEFPPGVLSMTIQIFLLQIQKYFLVFHHPKVSPRV